MQNLKELNKETVTTPPTLQKFNRKLTLEKEHKDALERAVSLNIPHAEASYEESPGKHDEGNSEDRNVETSKDNIEVSSEKRNPSGKNAQTNWNETVAKLFEKKESGKLILKRDVSESI